MDPEDLQTMLIDVGDGTQTAVEALARGSVTKVLRRIATKFQQAGIDIKDWICNPNEFDLCEKLKTTLPGKLMEDFNAFFSNKWTERGLTAAHAATVIPALALHAFAPFLVTFAALGVINKGFVELCDCK